MDIPALSIAMSSMKTAEAVNIAMLKKANDTMLEQGQQVAEMIQDSSCTVDIKV